MCEIIIGYLLGFFSAVFTEPFRQWLFKPKLTLEFGSEVSGCVSRTRIANSRGEHVADAFYVRVKVTNNSRFTARNCRAYLINVEKKDNAGKFIPTIYCDSIPLAWSCQGQRDPTRPLDIPKGVNQYVDVLSTNSQTGLYRPEITPIPFRYTELFEEAGEFVFTLQVAADQTPPVTTKVELEWHGSWDTFRVALGN